MNFSEIAENVGLTVDEFVEIATSFVAATHSDLKLMRAGIQGSQPQQVYAAAHSIKGAALTFGFAQLHAAALGIEKEAREERLEAVSEAADLIEHELEIIANTLEHRSWT
jgi:HPt (histidine-containing phosphotransfer) domain-containing protein